MAAGDAQPPDDHRSRAVDGYAALLECLTPLEASRVRKTSAGRVSASLISSLALEEALRCHEHCHRRLPLESRLSRVATPSRGSGVRTAPEAGSRPHDGRPEPISKLRVVTSRRDPLPSRDFPDDRRPGARHACDLRLTPDRPRVPPEVHLRIAAEHVDRLVQVVGEVGGVTSASTTQGLDVVHLWLAFSAHVTP